MFIGQYEAVLGEKNRIAIPKKFRNELGEKFIIAKWYEGCLVLVSGKYWSALLEKLRGRSKIITLPVRDTDRFILGSAYEVEPDSQGRVVLPEKLVKYASLKNEVSFLGLGDRIEIWDKVLWEKREKFISENAEKLVEKLAQISDGQK